MHCMWPRSRKHCMHIHTPTGLLHCAWTPLLLPPPRHLPDMVVALSSAMLTLITDSNTSPSRTDDTPPPPTHLPLSPSCPRA